MDDIQIGELEISKFVLIGLTVSEIAITAVKSYMFKKKKDGYGILFFIIEALIGIALTALTSASLFNRVVAWKRYPIASSVGLGFFESFVIVLEAFLIFNLVSRDGDDRENDETLNIVTFLYFNISSILYTIISLFLLISACLTIIITRLGRQKSGDFPVEVTTVFVLFYCVLVLPFQYRRVIKKNPMIENSNAMKFITGLTASSFVVIPLPVYVRTYKHLELTSTSTQV